MNEQHYKWHSPVLNRETEMLVYGEGGYPIITFPTSMGRHFQNRDFKLIESAEWFVNNGYIKIYCVDGIDEESWYNKKVSPEIRVQNHLVYDSFIRNEIFVRAQSETDHAKVALAGCSFGGYHATNFAFRYPETVGYVFSMSGAFDIKPQMDGYYDDQVFYNNPPDYLPGLENPALHEMGIILGAGEHDICLEANKQLSEILTRKGISHWLDIRMGANHDWPVWREMFPHYISQMKF